MNVISIIAIYFIVWWVVLFAVLPFGVRTQQEEGDIVVGTAHSAPVRPMLVRKALITSVITAVIVAGIHIAMTRFGLNIEGLSRMLER